MNFDHYAPLLGNHEFNGDFAELEAALEATYLLLYKLLAAPDPGGHGYIGSPEEAFASGGWSIVLDHEIGLSDEEAEFIKQLQRGPKP